MKHIILEANETAGIGFDVADLAARLNQLTDTRDRRGKTMCGTIPKGSTHGVHLLSAFLPGEGVVLEQLEVGDQENEISAAPSLVAKLNLKQRVVCGNALHTQRQLSVAVLGQGGDYLWFLKANQPTLLADVEQFFKPAQHHVCIALLPLCCPIRQIVTCAGCTVSPTTRTSSAVS